MATSNESAQGYVAEASGENLFMVKNGVIRTPELAGPVLAGIKGSRPSAPTTSPLTPAAREAA